MADPRFPKLIAYVVKKFPEDKARDPAHGADHLLRVYKTGMLIGKEEKADLNILGPALLLHDAIRPKKEQEDEKHARASAQFAKKILPHFGYSKKEVEKITNAILCHSRSDIEEGKKTLEARIVYDADKQDGLGAIGIERVKAFCKARGYNSKQTASYYLYRILDIIENEPFYTEKGGGIANKKLQASLRFCKSVLGKEYEKMLKKETMPPGLHF